MDQTDILSLDPVIHAPIRLAIVTILAQIENASFGYLKESVGTSDGNLSTHLSKLEQAGYIRIQKKFVSRKPLTQYSLTTRGRTAFMNYIDQMDSIVNAQRNTVKG
ncbi:transcriptional regulator [bacterium]|nr:transcriptional regulator [bacterium]